MQPTEPTPSPADQAAETPDSPDSTAPDSESTSPSWWQRLLGRREEPTESEAQEAEEPADSERRVLSEEEFQRLVQSEADKRIAAQNKAARDAARAEERRRLRDEDPWQFAENERQAEQ